MRRLATTTAATLLALAAGLAGTSPASAAQSGFAGRWVSVDTDGSDQTLLVQGAGRGAYGVVLEDDEATFACGGAPARLAGSGRADGDVLWVVGALTCLPGGNTIRHRIEFGFELVGDTLVDVTGVVWTRA